MVAVIRVMAPRLKRFIPEVGPVKIDQPRDRAGSFKSCLLPPGQRRLAGLDGIKHVLDIWVQAAEGAKFWLIIGLLYIAMGYWIATPICVVAGIIAELIVDCIERCRSMKG